MICFSCVALLRLLSCCDVTDSLLRAQELVRKGRVHDHTTRETESGHNTVPTKTIQNFVVSELMTVITLQSGAFSQLNLWLYDNWVLKERSQADLKEGQMWTLEKVNSCPSIWSPAP